jgi:hypothetical protein
MTTALQRASSKSSAGSTTNSFIHKLTVNQKAGVEIAHHQGTNPVHTAALHVSAQTAMTAFKRDSSFMTAK